MTAGAVVYSSDHHRISFAGWHSVMKTTTLISLALSALDAAAIKFITGPEGWAPAMGFNATKQAWENVKLPPHIKRAEAPKRQEMKPRVKSVPGSKTVKLRYGPYTVPAPML
jgi:hypothetical protein